MDEARASAADARRTAAALAERVESLQGDLNHSELRREELETELTNTQEVRRRCRELHPSLRELRKTHLFLLRQVLRQRTSTLTEAQRSVQSAQAERAGVEERLRALQRAVAMLETEKKDAERQAVRLEKDKDALRNTLDKVSS